MAAAIARLAAISFDLDGTLVDTGEEIAAAANRALRDLGLAGRPTGAIVRHVGHGGRALMRGLIEDADPGAVVDLDAAHARFDARYAEVAGTLSRPYPGAAEALARLRAKGIRIACLTNKNEAFSHRVLEAAGLARSVELVVGGDTLGVRKPDPGVVGHALDTFACAPEAFAHVGDSATDVAAARAASVAAWAVPWGYNAGLPIETARPDRVFASFDQIATFVLDR